MSLTNKQLLEMVALIAQRTDAAVAAPATVSTNWIKVSDFNRVCAIVRSFGSAGDGQTTDAFFEQAKDDSGTDSQPIESDESLSFDGNGYGAIEMLTDRMELNDGYSYIRLTVSNDGEAADITSQVFGYNPRYAEVEQPLISNIVTVFSSQQP